MSGSWGADFGAGLWGALDREAQDFQKRRIARKEEERRKRLAEEERLRQEALANQRAQNIFEMNNQSLDPIYDAAGQAGMVPYANLAVQKLLGQSGINGQTVGGMMDAQKDMLAQKAYEDQQRKELQDKEDRQYTLDQRNYNKYLWNDNIRKTEEYWDKKPKLDAEAEADKALKKKWDTETHNAQMAESAARIANQKSQAEYHKAQANYWNNGGRSGGNGKVQEQLDPEEQKFIDLDKAYEEQIKKISKEIDMYDGDSRGYESTSFDKADASKNKAVALRDKRQELINAKNKNIEEYQKWKSNKGKPVAKTSSVKIRDVVNALKNIGMSIKDSLTQRTWLNKLQTKIEEDFYKQEAEKALKRKLEEEARKKARENMQMQEAQKIKNKPVESTLNTMNYGFLHF